MAGKVTHLFEGDLFQRGVQDIAEVGEDVTNHGLRDQMVDLYVAGVEGRGHDDSVHEGTAENV